MWSSENQQTQYNYYQDWTYMPISNMNLAVESFFVLSACLVTISFMKAMQRQNDNPTGRQMALYYFHRYWRLTPVYMLLLMTWTGLFAYVLERGPQYPTPFSDAGHCRYHWWTNLLYLHNLINDHEMCMGWTWYLANDFQFYVFAPAFIIIMYKWPKIGIPFLFLGWCGSVAASAVIYVGILDGTRSFFLDFYFKPWCRFAPFAIGHLLGYVMFKTKTKIKMYSALAVLFWLFSLFLVLWPLYGNFNRGPYGCLGCNPWSRGLEITFEATRRSSFALGVSGIIFLCSTGYGGFINTILSWKFFVPLARLSYISYLVHPMILYYFYYTRMRLLYVDITNMIIHYGAILLYTVVVAFVLTLVLEVPFMLLEKVIIPKQKRN